MTIQVPSLFDGSEAGTLVSLGPGNYQVNETIKGTVAADIETLGGNITGPNISFTGNCIQTGENSTSATGDILAGETQDCGITNQFLIDLIDTCPECIINALTPDELEDFLHYLGSTPPPPETPVGTLSDYCNLFVGLNVDQIVNRLNVDFGPNGGSIVKLTPEEIQALAECIFAALNEEATVQQSIQQQSMNHHQQQQQQPAQHSIQQQSMDQLEQLKQLQQQLQQNNIKSSINSQQQNQNSIGSITSQNNNEQSKDLSQQQILLK